MKPDARVKFKEQLQSSANVPWQVGDRFKYDAEKSTMQNLGNLCQRSLAKYFYG